MVAGGNSKSSDAPSQAAPNLPFGVQSLPASPQLPVFHVNDGRSASYVVWETALQAANGSEPYPPSPARNQGTAPHIIDSSPYFVTSTQSSEIDADTQALLAEALDDFDETPNSQCSNAQSDHSSSNLQTGDLH